MSNPCLPNQLKDMVCEPLTCKTSAIIKSQVNRQPLKRKGKARVGTFLPCGCY